MRFSTQDLKEPTENPKKQSTDPPMQNMTTATQSYHSDFDTFYDSSTYSSEPKTTHITKILMATSATFHN